MVISNNQNSFWLFQITKNSFWTLGEQRLQYIMVSGWRLLLFAAFCFSSVDCQHGEQFKSKRSDRIYKVNHWKGDQRNVRGKYDLCRQHSVFLVTVLIQYNISVYVIHIFLFMLMTDSLCDSLCDSLLI